MHVFLFAMLLLAAEYWDKPPAEWNRDQVEAILTASPWAQIAQSTGRIPAPPLLVYIASAEATRLAEAELRRREWKPKREDLLADDYRAWLAEDGGSHIVLAIRVSDARAFDDAQEVKRMEKECFVKIGRKKVKIDGHFPPSSSDPFVRLAFPKEGADAEKLLQFELYIPGAPSPYRTVEFPLKGMLFHGKLNF